MVNPGENLRINDLRMLAVFWRCLCITHHCSESTHIVLNLRKMPINRISGLTINLVPQFNCFRFEKLTNFKGKTRREI